MAEQKRTGASKALLPLYLLEILWHQADVKHPLNSRKILDLLQEQYGLTVDRKTVFHHLKLLKEGGLDISTFEENGEGYYLRERFLDDLQITVLLDALVTGSRLTPEDQKMIARNLLFFASRNYPVKMHNIYGVWRTYMRERPKETYQMLILLDKAIDQKRMVGFNYNRYGVDGQFHNMKDHRFFVNPYQCVCVDGQYYLIANYDGYDYCTCYRLNRISELRIEAMTARPLDSIPGMQDEKAIERLVNREIIHGGEDPITAILRIDESLIDRLIDRFSLHVEMTHLSSGKAEAVVSAAPAYITEFALTNSDRCEVVHPASLKAQVRDRVRELCLRYSLDE